MKKMQPSNIFFVPVKHLDIIVTWECIDIGLSKYCTGYHNVSSGRPAGYHVLFSYFDRSNVIIMFVSKSVECASYQN